MDSQNPLGTFVGDIEVIWRRDSNLMILTKPFSFVAPEDLDGNPNSYTWTAPIGTETDGASIPKQLWSLGHPFEAPYRAASVIHDSECKLRVRPWPAVHKMFYLACLCGGTRMPIAKAMYWGVSNFGPRWGGYINSAESSVYLLPPKQEDLESVLRRLETEDIPIEQVPYIRP